MSGLCISDRKSQKSVWPILFGLRRALRRSIRRRGESWYASYFTACTSCSRYSCSSLSCMRSICLTAYSRTTLLLYVPSRSCSALTCRGGWILGFGHGGAERGREALWTCRTRRTRTSSPSWYTAHWQARLRASFTCCDVVQSTACRNFGSKRASCEQNILCLQIKNLSSWAIGVRGSVFAIASIFRASLAAGGGVSCAGGAKSFVSFSVVCSAYTGREYESNSICRTPLAPIGSSARVPVARLRLRGIFSPLPSFGSRAHWRSWCGHRFTSRLPATRCPR
mmetsp:Transcript_68871/g.192355  ORF Transcript_68871/g.192355 Transcript_68871/m.192355 type:complete len:281 (-) Transcript_68871:2225-3067(-)